MHTARRHSTTALLAPTLGLTYLATAATAGAMPPPPLLPDTPNPNQSPPPVTTVITHTGSPVWTYLVVALAAAALSLAAAWAVTRFRDAHAGAASVQTVRSDRTTSRSQAQR